MATKAEKFKASAQINASIEHKKASAKKGTKSNGAGEKESDGSIAQATKGNNAPARKRPQSKAPATDMPKTSATDRKAGGNSTADRNRSVRAAKKASYELEDSATDRPSRKSTRRAENRAKPDSNLKRRQVRKTSSPKERAVRASAERA
ncbi:MAG: hypothetical protein HUU21_25145 [Polyangiaceae bacterium]|nr:hypothetical protein [Polyangiaceae bacterium]